MTRSEAKQQYLSPGEIGWFHLVDKLYDFLEHSGLDKQITITEVFNKWGYLKVRFNDNNNSKAGKN